MEEMRQMAAINKVTVEPLDKEWVILMRRAQEMGLSAEEVRAILHNLKHSKSIRQVDGRSAAHPASC